MPRIVPRNEHDFAHRADDRLIIQSDSPVLRVQVINFEKDWSPMLDKKPTSMH